MVKLIETFGKNILFIYDISCMFSQTLSKSPIGNMVCDTNFKSCTGSFHGAAHNRSCQLKFLISIQKGAGTEMAKAMSISIQKATHLPQSPATHHHTINIFELRYILLSGMR